MKIKQMHPGFIMPTKGSEFSGAYDIYMPYDSTADGNSQLHRLGFAAAVPEGHVALLLPRSSAGAKHGLELNNTCGVIDEDYRGEWMAAIRTKGGRSMWWNAGDRILQFIIVPVLSPVLSLTDELPPTARGTGGFGSTGT